MAADPVPPRLVDEWERELLALLEIVPARVARAVLAEVGDHTRLKDITLLEGRTPMVRLRDRDTYVPLSLEPVQQREIDELASRFGFDSYDRAAMPGLLHRISRVAGSDGVVYGIEARVGRGVPGVAEVLRDLIESGESILIAGPAGAGKTTLLRDASRIMSSLRATTVVDKCRELGGASHRWHPALGEMLVRLEADDPRDQYTKMLRGLQNHSPRGMVVDEIGNADEVYAARDIAQAGVQLIATTHAGTLRDLIESPRTRGLMGADPVKGYAEVIFGDANMDHLGKAGRRRVDMPAFTTLVFIADPQTLYVYRNVPQVVDDYLRIPAEVQAERRRLPAPTEVRGWGDAAGRPAPAAAVATAGEKILRPAAWAREDTTARTATTDPAAVSRPADRAQRLRFAAPAPCAVALFGVSPGHLSRAARDLELPVRHVTSVDSAEALICVRSMRSHRGSPVQDAERRGIPVFYVRSNAARDVAGALQRMYDLDPGGIVR